MTDEHSIVTTPAVREYIRLVADLTANMTAAMYAEAFANECREQADLRPWSTEAETLLRVAARAARDAEIFHKRSIELQVDDVLRRTDLDELAERLTQT